MAYNLMQLARRRHLRARCPDAGWLSPPWRQVFGWLLRVLYEGGDRPAPAPS